MPRFFPALLCACVMIALGGAPAQAKIPVSIGIGEQSPAMFKSKNFTPLGIKKVRYFMRWDAARRPYAIKAADAFVAAARRAQAGVYIHISTNDYRKRSAKLPSVREYRKYVGKLVRRYRSKGVREWGVWNEANHYTEPTYKNPARAAQYFHAMRGLCPGCTIVALDMLDQRGADSYIARFYKALSGADRAAAKLVGIHNYGDTNRHRTTGTRSIISAVRRHNRRSTFWFTETGGIVKLGHSFPCSPSRAARSLGYMFTLASMYRRDVTRLYAYNWFGTRPSCHGFDSGLVNANGKPRKGYAVFKTRAGAFAR